MTHARNGDKIKPGDTITYTDRYTGEPGQTDIGIYISDDTKSSHHCYIIDPNHNKIREIWIRRDSILNRINKNYRDMDPAFIRQLHNMPADDSIEDAFEDSLDQLDFDYYL